MAGRINSAPLDVCLHPLAYVRHERGWSLQDLVDLLARRVGNMASRREKAWRWENWGVIPDHETQLALAAELGVAADAVGALGWPNWLPVGDRIDAAFEWTWDGALAALDRETESAMLDRRGFLTLGAGVTAALADQWVNTDAPRLMSALCGGRLDPITVDCFEQRLPTMRALDASLGGSGIRSVVDSELSLATNLLISSSYDEGIGRRMVAVAAELGRVAGWASFDAGFHAAAERYWTAALRAAHAADDRVLGANILKCMSLQCVDLNRTGDALSMARSALAGAKHAQPRIVAMLTVRVARTYAATGDRTASEHLLAAAETAMGRADDHEVPAWASYFDRAEYCAQAASCYRLLKRPEHAEFWLAQALELQPASRTRDRATYRMWHADNFLNLKNIEQACVLTGLALPDLQTSRSARNTRRLSRLRNRLGQYNDLVQVRGLNEQIDSMELT